MRAEGEGKCMLIWVHMCMPVYVEARDNIQSSPGPSISTLFLFHFILFCLLCQGLSLFGSSRAGWVDWPASGICLSLPTRSPSMHQHSELFRWVLGIKPQLSGLHEEHFAN